ncbi:MAG: polysaccharide deacetylase family protein [Agriterribacter sp.]
MKYNVFLFSCLFICYYSAAQQKTVVLTFDDAITSHYSVAAPVLKQYGFGATFYVCEFPPDFADSAKYLNWRQIKSLAADGFEIGNHTWHHTGVNDISMEKLDTEIAYIEKKCISLKIPMPVSFAYPGCPPSKPAAELLRKRGYTSARTCEARAYVPGKDDPFFLPSYAIGGTDTSVFYNALQQQKPGEIVVFLFHGVPDHAHEWVNTPEDVFRKYMAYLHRMGYKVVGMREVLDK